MLQFATARFKVNHEIYYESPFPPMNKKQNKSVYFFHTIVSLKLTILTCFLK